jgi:hypothetical protein
VWTWDESRWAFAALASASALMGAMASGDGTSVLVEPLAAGANGFALFEPVGVGISGEGARLRLPLDVLATENLPRCWAWKSTSNTHKRTLSTTGSRQMMVWNPRVLRWLVLDVQLGQVRMMERIEAAYQRITIVKERK